MWENFINCVFVKIVTEKSIIGDKKMMLDISKIWVTPPVQPFLNQEPNKKTNFFNNEGITEQMLHNQPWIQIKRDSEVQVLLVYESTCSYIKSSTLQKTFKIFLKVSHTLKYFKMTKINKSFNSIRHKPLNKSCKLKKFKISNN